MKGSKKITYFNHTTSATTERTEAAAPSTYEAADGITINFHSAEFNQTDDLNDYSGNYRIFQSLDGVVTADMRHQMERLCRRDVADADADDAAPSKKIEQEKNEAATLDASPPLTVISQGLTFTYEGDGLPMGYYASGTNPANLHEVMAVLPGMRSRLHRPQFTAFLKNRCLHGLSRTIDCRQCLAVCPFDAIQSVDRTISIDHYRCQSCGGCAMVCPADAIQMVQPSQQELLSILRRKLEDRSAGVAFPQTLVISDLEAADGYQSPGIDEGNDGHRVHFVVEQIGYVGLEMLLAALAYGAGAVVVACGAQTPPNIRMSAEWQAQMGSAILRGLDMPEDKIRFAVIPIENNLPEKIISAATGTEARLDKPLFPPATFSHKHDKRTLTRLATQHLYDQSGLRQPCITLPAGSPFGAVAVDSAACTLCMACAVACPSGALSITGNVPRLEFIESRCHQCRLCTEACPEGAMHLLPRMLCDLAAVEAPAVLNEAEPVRCIECGVPFAPQAMISRIQSKLTGHWMYAAERQLRRLRMCRTCRIQDALVSQDMKSWNQ